MRRVWLSGILLVLAVSVHAESGASGTRVASVETATVSDWPVGEYSAVTKWNAGFLVRGDFGNPAFPNVTMFTSVANSYWVVKPAWVTRGTEVGVLLGLATSSPLPKFDWGTPSWGASVGLGVSGHFARADITGNGDANFAFFDPTLCVGADLGLAVLDSPWSVYLRPQYLWAPENQHQKQQVDLLLGVRYVFAQGVQP